MAIKKVWIEDGCISCGLCEEMAEEVFEVELETGEAISTFVYSKTDWETKHHITPLYQNIKTEGISLK